MMCINILIGSDFYWSIFENALKSKLGYILSGPMQYESCNNSSTLTCHVLKCQTEFISPEEDLAETLNRFWEIECYEQTSSRRSL